jgi:branched-chain amino acid transport system ATP-binding protein
MAPGETDRMNEMIQRLSREHGTTILFCEHDMRFVFALAQTITVMHHGSILIEGAPEAVRSDATVQEVYLGSGEL